MALSCFFSLAPLPLHRYRDQESLCSQDGFQKPEFLFPKLALAPKYITVNISRQKQEQWSQSGVLHQTFYLADGQEHTLTYLTRGQITQSHSGRDPVLCTGRENDSKSSRKNLRTHRTHGHFLQPIPAWTILLIQTWHSC